MRSLYMSSYGTGVLHSPVGVVIFLVGQMVKVFAVIILLYCANLLYIFVDARFVGFVPILIIHNKCG